ncbi:MAG: hypothetical protein EU530_07350 [Promethearchaeota archaeon]|nr:MAG: hypothetical protein EU530_07350 [Candidatus Lokiarchaeota archaeon]
MLLKKKILSILILSFFFGGGVVVYINIVKAAENYNGKLEYEADFFSLIDSDENYFGNERYMLKLLIDYTGDQYLYTIKLTNKDDDNLNENFVGSYDKVLADTLWVDPFLLSNQITQNNFTISKSPESNLSGYIEETGRYYQISWMKKVKSYIVRSEITLPHNASNLFYISEKENICIWGGIYGNDSFLSGLFGFTYVDLRIVLINSNPSVEAEFFFNVGPTLILAMISIASFIALYLVVRYRRKKSREETRRGKKRKK